MCGIAGLVGPPTTLTRNRDAVLRSMARCLEHRGPDAEGILVEGPLGLAHRRLAVLGLGAAGAQPMTSATGRYAVAYNGEIYNHAELRRILEREGRAPSWRGGSDTETLLAGIEAWGLDGFLHRSVGMFAFALWDRDARVLSLVRDRLGEKPLSWAMHAGSLAFASQPAALRELPGFTPSVDPDAVAQLLRYGHVPGTRTIHREVHRLAPGTVLEIRVDDSGRILDGPDVRTWWSFEAAARAGVANPLRGSDRELTEAVGATLRDAVRGQLVSDVPVGAFLSGGIDSSLVVANMCAVASERVRTFTIGFAEDDYDESRHARAVADHLGADHTELILSADDALRLVPELPRIFDEPFADPSQLPTVLVSRLARGAVTVALSGDGGDELFGGYDRYARAERQARIPLIAGLAAAAAFGLMGRPDRQRAALTLGRGSDVLVRRMLSQNTAAEALVPGADRHADAIRFSQAWATTEGLGSLTERFMALDTTGYLPDDILHKVDRAAMSVSLETRMPLLDHRFVELAWRLPATVRLGKPRSKWLLRELLAEHVPTHLVDRPKAGFAVPVGRWLRGPLRSWADDLLSPESVRREGIFDPAAVSSLWASHRSGRFDRQWALWPILMFRAWAEAG